MKKVVKLFLVVLLIIPLNVLAKRGCCSHHGGVCGCTSYGKQLCCDGTASPSCTCEPPKVYGCTDPKADNYNPKANKDNGKCKYTIYGCMDKKANNYNSKANKDDKSCTYDVYGCTDSKANNYNKDANKDDGKCTYDILGCTDSKADNYNKEANKDDGSCKYKKEEITNNKTSTSQDSDDYYRHSDNTSVPGIIPVALLGGGGYAVYKAAKKKREQKQLENENIVRRTYGKVKSLFHKKH